MFGPIRIDVYKHLYVHVGKLFRGLRIDDLNDHVHVLKKIQQRETLLGREVCRFLFNIPPDLRKLVLALVNAILEDVVRVAVDDSADIDEFSL